MNLSDETKKQLISAAKTFAIAFFGTAVALFLKADEISWTISFWSAIAMAGFRAGLTAVMNPYLPVKLGGKKI